MPVPTPAEWRFIAMALARHARRRWWAYAIGAAAFVSVGSHYRIAINMSNSLPDSVYLIELGALPTQVGEYVAFEWQRDQFYRRNWLFVKRVGGVSGQTIDVRNRTIFVDGRPAGFAKRRSLLGVPLVPIRPGVIPADHWYVEADHPDSLDSRYEITGLVQAGRIVGKAYALF